MSKFSRARLQNAPKRAWPLIADMCTCTLGYKWREGHHGEHVILGAQNVPSTSPTQEYEKERLLYNAKQRGERRGRLGREMVLELPALDCISAGL